MKKSIHVFTRARRAIFAALAVAALAACATTSTPLRVETVGSPHGGVGAPRTFVSGSKLYVSGSMKRHIGHALPGAAHVDIQLIGSDGRVIAEKQDEINPVHPRHDRRHMGRYAYVVSFPVELARQAVAVRVSYHPSSHS